MRTRYRELFHIECRHEYFAGGLCRALELSPTAPCARLLDRYGCLFQRTVGGGSVYYGAPDAGPGLLRLFDEVSPFTFALAGSGGELMNCTEMAPARAGSPDTSLFHFSNLREHRASFDGKECILLHSPESPLDGGPVPVRAHQFVYTFPGPATMATVELFDMLDNPIWRSRTPARETNSLSLDFSGIAEGRYRLRMDGGAIFDFFLSGVAPSSRWGVVDIFPGGPAMAKVPERCRVLEASGVPASSRVFAVRLEPRRSFWRYYIVSQSTADRTYDGYRIAGGPPGNGKSSGRGSIAFSSPVRRKLNGKDAWVFESTVPIPLYERPSERHEFTLKNGTGGSAVALPYGQAETTRLARGADGEQRLWSEIYMYL